MDMLRSMLFTDDENLRPEFVEMESPKTKSPAKKKTTSEGSPAKKKTTKKTTEAATRPKFNLPPNIHGSEGIFILLASKNQIGNRISIGSLRTLQGQLKTCEELAGFLLSSVDGVWSRLTFVSERRHLAQAKAKRLFLERPSIDRRHPSTNVRVDGAQRGEVAVRQMLHLISRNAHQSPLPAKEFLHFHDHLRAVHITGVPDENVCQVVQVP